MICTEWKTAIYVVFSLKVFVITCLVIKKILNPKQSRNKKKRIHWNRSHFNIGLSHVQIYSSAASVAGCSHDIKKLWPRPNHKNFDLTTDPNFIACPAIYRRLAEPIDFNRFWSCFCIVSGLLWRPVIGWREVPTRIFIGTVVSLRQSRTDLEEGWTLTFSSRKCISCQILWPVIVPSHFSSGCGNRVDSAGKSSNGLAA